MVKPLFEGKDGSLFRMIDVRYVNAVYQTVNINGFSITFSPSESDDFKRFVKEYKEYITFFCEYEFTQMEEAIEHRKRIREFEKQERGGGDGV